MPDAGNLIASYSFPFEDPTVVVQIKGKAIWDALENGVCHYPALEGNMPIPANPLTGGLINFTPRD